MGCGFCCFIVVLFTPALGFSSFHRGPASLFTGKSSTRQRGSFVVMKDSFSCEDHESGEQKPSYFGYCQIGHSFYSEVPPEASVKQFTLVLIHGDGKILLGMKKRGFGQGKYNGFGGKVEAGESIEDAAAREFREETTVPVVGDLEKRAVLTFFFRTEVKIMQVHVFTADCSTLKEDPKETDEMSPKWFTIDQIPFDLMWADDVLWFPLLLDGKNFEGNFLFQGQTHVVLHELREVPRPWIRFCWGDGRNLGDVHDLSAVASADVLAARAFALQADRDLVLQGPKVALVPYRAEHVATYHAWMQDPELLQQTGSEPLSLDEEIAMQAKWAEDSDKATFILLERGSPDSPGTGEHGGRMVGDVNLFFYELDDPTHAEVSVMIPPRDARRRGLAREAVGAMLRYGYTRLGARTFAAKIDEGNEASISLFRSMGFHESSFSTAFRQHTLQWAPTAADAAAGLPSLPLTSARSYSELGGNPAVCEVQG